MKATPSALNTHLALETTSVKTCWKVTRTDGQVFGFTDHDTDLVVSSVTYEAATGYTRTAIQGSADLSVDNLDIEGAFDSAAITESDLRAGRWDYAVVEIFQVNWADLTMGVDKLRKGKFGQASAGRLRFTAELRGLMQHLQQEIGRLYGPADDVDLGDARNGLNIAAWTVTGTITGVTDARVFADTSRTEANGWFDGGKITFTSGLNNGLSMEVKTFLLSGGAIQLQLPMPFVVAIGNTYSLTAGYDKSLSQAANKFTNVVSYRGFPYVPGNDLVLSGGL